jgi:PilZ domain
MSLVRPPNRAHLFATGPRVRGCTAPWWVLTSRTLRPVLFRPRTPSIGEFDLFSISPRCAILKLRELCVAMVLKLTGGGAERRKRCRFPLVCELRYRLQTGEFNPGWCVGKTLDISSSGVRFVTEASPPPLGQWLELSIDWPVRLSGKRALKLVARGRIIRTFGVEVAVQIDQCEFRTHGPNGLLPQFEL